jgi:hypothetical protein
MEGDLDNTNRLAIVQPGTKGATFCCMFYCVTYGIVCELVKFSLITWFKLLSKYKNWRLLTNNGMDYVALKRASHLRTWFFVLTKLPSKEDFQSGIK